MTPQGDSTSSFSDVPGEEEEGEKPIPSPTKRRRRFRRETSFFSPPAWLARLAGLRASHASPTRTGETKVKERSHARLLEREQKKRWRRRRNCG